MTSGGTAEISAGFSGVGWTESSQEEHPMPMDIKAINRARVARQWERVYMALVSVITGSETRGGKTA